MKIKSINDVITNSSDEVYIIRSDKSAQEILNELNTRRNPEEYGSGMGGILTVKTHDCFMGNDEDYDKELTLPAGVAQVTVDNGFRAIQEYMDTIRDRQLETAIDDNVYIDELLDYFCTTKEYDDMPQEIINMIPGYREKFKKFAERINEICEKTFNK